MCTLLFCLLASEHFAFKKALKDPASFADLDTAYATFWRGAQVYGGKDSRTAASVGARFLRNGDQEAAEAWFRRAISRDKKDPETLLIVGRSYQLAGMLEKADDLFEKVLVLCSKDDDDGSLVAMAWMFADLGLIERAEKAIEAAIEADPGDYDNLMEWAAILFQTGDHAQALRVIEEALSHGKGTERLLIKANQIICGTYRSFYTILPMGSFPPGPEEENAASGPLTGTNRTYAISLANRLFQENPRRTAAARAGATLLALGEKERASVVFERAETTGKHEVDTLSMIAQAYYLDGQIEKAQRMLDKALAVARASDWPLATGWLCTELNRCSRIREIMPALANRNFVDSRAYLEVAAMHLKCGKNQSGLEMMRTYLRKDLDEEYLHIMGLELLEGVHRISIL